MIRILLGFFFRRSIVFDKVLGGSSDSFFLNYFFEIICRVSRIFERYQYKSFFLKKDLKKFTIFLFIVTLPIVFGSQIQLSNLSSNRIDLSQRQFGIIIFSLSNLLLFPLFFYAIRDSVRAKRTRILNLEIFLFLYLLISLTSAIISVDFKSSFVWLLKLTFSFSIYFIFSRITFKLSDLKIILLSFLTIILVEGLVVGSQAAAGSITGVFPQGIERFESASLDIAIPFMNANYFRVIGTFSHPNNLANYLSIILPILCFGAIAQKGFLKKLYYISVIICGAGIVLSLSRWGIVTGIFALLLVFALFLKFLNKEQFNFSFLRYILIIAVLVIIIIFTNQSLIRRFLNLSVSDGSLLTRIELTNQALYMIEQNPLFGVGSGAFTYYFINEDVTSINVSRSFLAPVHNFYLLIASETGLISLYLILIFFILLSYFFLKRINSLEKLEKLLALGIFASILTFLFNGLATMTSFTDRTGFLLSLLIGLLVNILYHSSPVSKFPKPSH